MFALVFCPYSVFSLLWMLIGHPDIRQQENGRVVVVHQKGWDAWNSLLPGNTFKYAYSYPQACSTDKMKSENAAHTCPLSAFCSLKSGRFYTLQQHEFESGWGPLLHVTHPLPVLSVPTLSNKRIQTDCRAL